jgi:hypothetical protein
MRHININKPLWVRTMPPPLDKLHWSALLECVSWWGNVSCAHKYFMHISYIWTNKIKKIWKNSRILLILFSLSLYIYDTAIHHLGWWIRRSITWTSQTQSNWARWPRATDPRLRTPALEPRAPLARAETHLLPARAAAYARASVQMSERPRLSCSTIL